MSKPKFPFSSAYAVARELCEVLKPVTHRLIVAGSMRRRRSHVGDVEILFIPRTVQVREDFFRDSVADLAADTLELMLMARRLEKRKTATGAETWGPKNKLARHVASGIPVDFFAATEANWWNYLVCRTGPSESNIAIASAAKRKGWQWHPYGAGFENPITGETRVMHSEREVFDFVGLPFKQPEER